MLSRREMFDAFVLDVAEAVVARVTSLGADAGAIEFAVDEVPPSDPAHWEHQAPALAQAFPQQHNLPARIVLYRRVIEMHAKSPLEQTALIEDVIVEEVANLLGLDPRELRLSDDA